MRTDIAQSPHPNETQINPPNLSLRLGQECAAGQDAVQKQTGQINAINGRLDQMGSDAQAMQDYGS